MKHFTYLIILIFLSCCRPNQGNSDNLRNSSLKDSLMKELQINDSIKILYTYYYEDTIHYVVFIDFNRHSKIFSDFENRFKQNNIYSINYVKMYKDQINDDSIKRIIVPSSLKHYWIPLYKYENQYYILDDCGFQQMYSINDSTFNTVNMDGESPEVIKDIVEKESSYLIELKNGNHYQIDIINKAKMICKLNIDNECRFYIPSNKIHEFDMIVVHCHDLNPLGDQLKIENKCD